MIALDPARSQDELCCFIGTTAALLLLAGAATTAGTTVYAANKSANAAEHAGTLQAKAADDQLAFAKQQAAQDQQNWERTQAFNIEQHNQQLDRLAPYIGAGRAANATLANLIGGPSFVAATNEPQPHASLPPQAGSPTASSADLQTASQKFLSAVQQAGLDPVAVQGHGRLIADAVNRIHPELALRVDPQSDAIVWNGIPIDVTVDSGKGGWSFRPAGGGSTTGARPRVTASSLLHLDDLSLPTSGVDPTATAMQTPRIAADSVTRPTTLSNLIGRGAA
jgi:hypothetical protein